MAKPKSAFEAQMLEEQRETRKKFGLPVDNLDEPAAPVMVVEEPPVETVAILAAEEGSPVVTVTPETPAPPAEPAVVATPPAPNTAEVELQHKLDVEAGRLKKANEDNEQLRKQFAELTERFSEVLGALEKVTAAPAPAPAPEAPAAPSAVFTPTDQEMLGELFEPVTRYVADAVAPLAGLNSRIAALEAQFGNLNTTVTGVQQDVQQDKLSKFEQALKSAVSNYLEIHGSPAFTQWLATKREKFSGIPLVDIYNGALNKDAGTVAGIMQEFLDAQQPAVISPAAETPPPVTTVAAPVPSVEDQVAPPRGSASHEAPKPRMAYQPVSLAEYSKASEDLQFKRNGMTQEKYDDIRLRYFKTYNDSLKKQ